MGSRGHFYSSSVIFEYLKNPHLLVGQVKNRIHLSLIAKSTILELLDMTFFVH